VEASFGPGGLPWTPAADDAVEEAVEGAVEGAVEAYFSDAACSLALASRRASALR
jgi:hypothetical protein